MTISNLSGTWHHVLWPAAAMTLAACTGGGVTPTVGGGGGTGASASPYVLYASNYVAYGAEQNGAFLHSVQDGDVIAKFNGNYNYGCYSSTQTDMNKTQLYVIEGQANSNGGPPNGQNCTLITNTPPTTANDYFFLAIKAPGTSATALIAPVDISESNKLLIQMGNTSTPSATAGHANVFTVTLTSDTVGDGSTLTARCLADQTLAVVGPDPVLSALGVINYVIPFSSLNCEVGTIETLKSDGVTTVAIAVVGDKNPNVVVGEKNQIAVGYVGFSK